MRTLLFITLLFNVSLVSAGWFDNTPLDTRTPVEKCMGLVSQKYTSDASVLALCGQVSTATAYSCVKDLSDQFQQLSKADIRACSYYNSPQALRTLRTWLNKGRGNDLRLIASLSFADTDKEAACVIGLFQSTNISSLSLSDINKCLDESFITMMKRTAVVDLGL